MWLNRLAEGFSEENDAVVDLQKLTTVVDALRAVEDYPDVDKELAMQIQAAAEKAPLKMSQLRELSLDVAQRYEEYQPVKVAEEVVTTPCPNCGNSINCKPEDTCECPSCHEMKYPAPTTPAWAEGSQVLAGPYHKSVTFELSDGYKGQITQEASGHYIAIVMDDQSNIVWHTNSIYGAPNATIEELKQDFMERWPSELRDIQRSQESDLGTTMDRAHSEDYDRDPDNSAWKKLWDDKKKTKETI